ncbi:hypothetical protein FORC066_1469 [Yersinia enterocolitica]|nr:hypothetical protein FORC065_2971 [Yersinia enterocolitica]UXD28684.1 hypothetical protein FORC066_1469 [Yersinia enterocolitica]
MVNPFFLLIIFSSVAVELIARRVFYSMRFRQKSDWQNNNLNNISGLFFDLHTSCSLIGAIQQIGTPYRYHC